MFVIDETKKSMLKTLVESGKNCLVTGATGAGKTTLCYHLAEEMGMNPIVINCGGTQDARSSLFGYFSLQDGNTKFEKADFLKALSTPNTLIILDELSRASDDAYNLIFPILDFRRDVRVDELEGDEKVITVDPSVRFIATANIGIEYSSTRSIDRALQDRFISFNLPYLEGKDLKKYIRSTHGSDVAKDSSQLLKLYDYSHKMFGQGKISTRISTRAVLDVIPLSAQFKLKDILDYVVLSIFEQDSSSIVNDANILREYADSIGVYEGEQTNG
jgi:nitric oxide reductase NorQ protein